MKSYLSIDGGISILGRKLHDLSANWGALCDAGSQGANENGGRVFSILDFQGDFHNPNMDPILQTIIPFNKISNLKDIISDQNPNQTCYIRPVCFVTLGWQLEPWQVQVCSRTIGWVWTVFECFYLESIELSPLHCDSTINITSERNYCNKKSPF